MFSYHRVLATFGRSVKDKTRECDCDIHPWEIEINGEQWPGKIRLIGFVDVFFLISYSANARFEKGIIIYKEKHDIEALLKPLPDTSAKELENVEVDSESEADDIPEDVHPQEDEIEKEKAKGNFHEFNNAGRYIARGWGHEIGLKYRYPKSCIQRYDIKISKPSHWALRRGIKRGIKEHTTAELLEDVARSGFIWHGQMTGEFLSKFVTGGVLDDTTSKYFEAMQAANRPGDIALSNESVA